MPDVFTPAKRSEVMSRIRSRGNKDTELRLMAVFRAHGFTGWRRHVVIRGHGTREKGQTAASPAPTIVKARPDFVFPRLKVAVFVDGCFWHACPKCYVRPVQNRTFWDAKRELNQARDKRQTRALRRAGWTVLRLWEHDLARKREPRLVAKLQRILAAKS